MQRHLRLSAMAATCGLLTVGLLPAPPVQAAAPGTPAASIAADWLAAQLTGPAAGGLVKTGGKADYGSSIDAASALKAAGKTAAATTVHDAVVASGSAYVQYDAQYSDGEYSGTYAGHAAKLLALEVDQPAAVDPPCPVTLTSAPTPARPEGTCELQKRLLDTMTPSGQVQDTFHVVYNGTDGHPAGTTADGFAIPGDPEHVTQAGQAYAAYALAKLAVAKPTDTNLQTKAPLALLFLLGEQSTAGGFCVEQTAAACTAPDALTTAQVVLELQQMPLAAPTTAAISRAQSWLATAQRSDGSFGDAVTTGLAATALATSNGSNARLAAVWLRQSQADELAACPDGLSGSTGAVALTVQDRNAGRAGGIPDTTRGSWERATTAAIAGLDSLPPRSTSPVTFAGPGGFRRAGAVLTYDATNEAPGDLVCVTGGTALSRGWADITGHASVRVTMPFATVDQVLTLHDHTGIDHQVVTRVLGPQRFSVSSVGHRQRGHRFRITTFGLQPNENFSVRLRGATIASGRAPASGIVTVSYRIRRHAKPGRAQILVVGQTGDRYGVKYLRITR